MQSLTYSEIWKSEERKFSGLTSEQDRVCMYDVKLGHFRLNSVVVLVHNYYIF